VIADNTDSTFWSVSFDYSPAPVAELHDLCAQLQITDVRLVPEPGH